MSQPQLASTDSYSLSFCRGPSSGGVCLASQASCGGPAVSPGAWWVCGEWEDDGGEEGGGGGGEQDQLQQADWSTAGVAADVPTSVCDFGGGGGEGGKEGMVSGSSEG